MTAIAAAVVVAVVCTVHWLSDPSLLRGALVAAMWLVIAWGLNETGVIVL